MRTSSLKLSSDFLVHNGVCACMWAHGYTACKMNFRKLQKRNVGLEIQRYRLVIMIRVPGEILSILLTVVVTEITMFMRIQGLHTSSDRITWVKSIRSN